MTLDLNSLPDLDQPATTDATDALADIDQVVRRRTVLKGVTLSAIALGTGALSMAGASKAAAETSPTGLTGWDANDCKDAYPNGYNEQRDNYGIYTAEPGACFGGTFIGSNFCDAAGWYRNETDRYNQTYRPISSACGATSTKNAWRWTVNGVTYRCSDGRITIPSYWYYSRTYLAICRAKV